MPIFSPTFEKDIKNPYVDITPVIFIAEKNFPNDYWSILDAYSTKSFFTYFTGSSPNYGINIKPILNRISSIKNGVDYDRKTLKINRFRFSLFYDDTQSNIYDKLMGKYVLLDYKTPNNYKYERDINVESYNSTVMSRIFTGIVNRVTISGDSINIQAEDFTQISIKDKDIPTAKVEDYLFDLDGYEIIKYSDKDKAIPMVFGSVDKAPCVNLTTGANGSIVVTDQYLLHDSRPVYGSFQTRPIQATPDTGGEVGIRNKSDIIEFGSSPEYYFYKTSQPTHLYVKLDNGWGFFNNSGGEGEYGNYEAPPDSVGFNIDFRPNDGFTTFSSSDLLLFPEYNYGSLNEYRKYYAVGVMKPSGWVSTIPKSSNSNINTVGGITDVPRLMMWDSGFKYYDNQVYNGGYPFKWYRDGEDEYFNVDSDRPDGFNFIVDINHEDDPEDELPDGVTPNFFGEDFMGNGSGVILRFPRKVKLSKIFTWLQIYQQGGTNHQYGSDIQDRIYILPMNDDFWSSVERGNTPAQCFANGGSGNNAHIIDFIDEGLQDAAGAAKKYINYSAFTKEGFSYDNITEAHLREPLDAHFLFYNGFATEADITPFETDKILIFGINNEEQFYQDVRSMVYDTYISYLDEISDIKTQEFYSSIIGRIDFDCTEDELGYSTIERTFEEVYEGEDEELPDAELLVNLIDGFLKELAYISIKESDKGSLSFNHNHKLDQNPFTSSTHAENIQALLNTVYDFDDSGMLRSFIILEDVIWKFYFSFLTDPVTQSGSFLSDFYEDWRKESPFSLQYYQTDEDYIPYDNIPNNEHGLEDLYLDHDIHTKMRRICARIILKWLFQDQLGYTGSSNENFLYSIFGATSGFPDELDTNLLEEIPYPYNINYYLFFEQSIVEGGSLEENLPFLFTYIDAHINAWQEFVLFYSTDATYDGTTFDPNDSILSSLLISQNLENIPRTNGIVEKPSDIIINILIREMKYGLNEDGSINQDVFDIKSIIKSREAHVGWKMSCCIDDRVDGKTVIEKIANESKSYTVFNFLNQFGFVTISERYTYDDIDLFIDPKYVLKHKFKKSKREEIYHSSKCLYRYDNGYDNYIMETPVVSAKDLYPDYDIDYYNINEDDGHKDIELRYHSNKSTALEFQRFDLMNKCNDHLMIELELPLRFLPEIGNIIYFNSLIENEKAFGMDYTQIVTKNQQIIYPLFIVMSTNIGLDSVKIKAYQLHFLADYNDSDHGFDIPESEVPPESPEPPSIIDACMTSHSDVAWWNNGDIDGNNNIPNWNFLPEEDMIEGNEYVDGICIPYYDYTGDGVINVLDVVQLVNLVLSEGASTPTLGQLERMHTYSSDGTEWAGADYNVINVIDIVQLVNLVLVV